MTIGELSRRTGIRPSAIRYYEGAGLLKRPGRISGQRVYAQSAETEVQVINAARELGFGIREIRTLVESRQAPTAVTERWRALARRKLPELERLIDRATRMKDMLENGLNCGCAQIEDCLLHECKPQVLQIKGLGRTY